METFSQLIVDGNLINSTVNIDDQPQYVHRDLVRQVLGKHRAFISQ